MDNPLVRCLDAAFVGWHLLRPGREMTSKMVPKAYPEERVGHFCLQGGRLRVIRVLGFADGVPARDWIRRASFDTEAGSIAIHILDREFIRRMARSDGGSALPFHRADKENPRDRRLRTAGEARPAEWGQVRVVRVS